MLVLPSLRAQARDELLAIRRLSKGVVTSRDARKAAGLSPEGDVGDAIEEALQLQNIGRLVDLGAREAGGRRSFIAVLTKMRAWHGGSGLDQGCRFALDECHVKSVGLPFRPGEYCLQEGEVRRHAIETELGKRPSGFCRTIVHVVGRGVDDDLRQHGIVSRACPITGISEMIHPEARSGRWFECRDVAASWPRSAIRFHRLQIDARLYCSPPRGVRSYMSNALAVGDIELQAHEIESGHRFRHRVFDLKAGVEFNESEGAVAAQQELDRPEAGILGSLGKIGGVLVECCPLIFGKTRGRRHLDNLLSPTLQTAIAVAKNDDIALLVRGYLHLDMSGVRD